MGIVPLSQFQPLFFGLLQVEIVLFPVAVRKLGLAKKYTAGIGAQNNDPAIISLEKVLATITALEKYNIASDYWIIIDGKVMGGMYGLAETKRGSSCFLFVVP